MIIVENKKDGRIVEVSFDWMFDSRYGYFILENRDDWKIIKEKKPLKT